MSNITKYSNEVFDLIDNRLFENEVAQLQAKAMIFELTGAIPNYNWTYVSHRIIRNIQHATFNIENILQNNILKSEIIQDKDLSKAALKIARVWESLAELEDYTKKDAALLNSAFNYELAGYQANALCIAKKIEKDLDWDTISLSNLFNLFIQRKFIKLVDILKYLQLEPEITNNLNDSLIEKMALALSSKGMENLINFYLRGDETLFNKGIDILNRSQKIYFGLGVIEETNLIRSIIVLSPLIKNKSIWTVLLEINSNSIIWKRYLKLLARGLSHDIYEGHSISELWPSQIKAIKDGFLSSSLTKVVKMPTSAGKTRLAELAIVHKLINNPGKKCIYVAPYLSLVSELRHSFLNIFRDLGFNVSSITGSYESDDFEEILFYHADILILTPEKLDLLFRIKPEFLEKVSLVVIDEAQIIEDKKRGTKFDLLITRLKNKLPNIQFLVLSAVIPQETLEDFATWLEASPQKDIFTSEWRPSIQRYAKFEWEGNTGVIRYMDDKENTLLKEFIPGVITEKDFEYIDSKSGRKRRKKFPSKINKSQISAELAFKFVEFGPVLIFCSKPQYVMSVANALQDRLKLANNTNGILPRDISCREQTKSSLLAEEWLGKESDVTKCLKSGFAVHHGQLPNILRDAIELDFKAKKYSILIATSTLAQGVNLPLRTVIVHSCEIYNIETKENYPITARDFWNIAGRAGRAGQETNGLIIHITLKERDHELSSYYVEHKNNVEPLKGGLYARVNDLVNERISEKTLINELDPEILALLVEEDLSNIEGIQEIINNSFAFLHINEEPKLKEEFNKVFFNTVEAINGNIPDKHKKQIYGKTGFNSESCKNIQFILSNKPDYYKNLFLDTKLDNLENLIDEMLFITNSFISEVTFPEFEGDYKELLIQWVRGDNIEDIFKDLEIQEIKPDVLVKIIDKLFRYELPWSFSGIIRIAIEVLDLDKTQLNNYVTFLPSMIKYGVPSFVACWAMGIGIPSRSIALRIASKYDEENPNAD